MEWSLDQIRVLHTAAGSPPEAPAYLGPATRELAWRWHRSMPGYRPTELVELPGWAARLGCGVVWVKDESTRFGLGAFKVLGSSFAIAQSCCTELGLDVSAVSFAELRAALAAHPRPPVFVTATTGNHGIGVAATACGLGARAVIYVPAHTSATRIARLERAGATEIVRVRGDHAAAVAAALDRATQEGWTLLQDTAWEGYTTAPTWIMQGYLTLVAELGEQLGERVPTHVFLPAGVGSLAAAVIGGFTHQFGNTAPRYVIVEPSAAPCCFEAARSDWELTGAPTTGTTCMAGLDCSEVSTLAVPILRNQAHWYCTCSDEVAAAGVRQAKRPCGSDPALSSGPSAGVSFGLLERLCCPDAAPVRDELGLGPHASVLLLNTEGSMD